MRDRTFESFGTNPDTLTRDQMRPYIRQLQQTIFYWQWQTATAMGLTRTELLERMTANLPLPDVPFTQEYDRA